MNQGVGKAWPLGIHKNFVNLCKTKKTLGPFEWLINYTNESDLGAGIASCVDFCKTKKFKVWNSSKLYK